MLGPTMLRPFAWAFIHTPSLSWLQNLNFKFGALRHEKRRSLAFYTGTWCLTLERPRGGGGGSNGFPIYVVEVFKQSK